MNEFLTLMKSELVITCIIFLLLFIKLSSGMKNGLLLLIIQNLLLLNFIIGFFFNTNGSLFNGMFHTNELIAFQKCILNFGVYLISLLFAGWFKKTEHLSEFFMLMLSSLLGLVMSRSSSSLGKKISPDSPIMEAIRHNSPDSWGDTKNLRMPRGHDQGCCLFNRSRKPKGKLPLEKATLANRAVLMGKRSE